MMTSWHRQRDNARWVDVYATIGGGTAGYNMVDVKHPYRKETMILRCSIMALSPYGSFMRVYFRHESEISQLRSSKHVQTLFPKHRLLTSRANCDYTGRQSCVQRLDFCRGYELGKLGGISWGAAPLVPIFRASLDRCSLCCYQRMHRLRTVCSFPPPCRQEVIPCSAPAARLRTVPGGVSAPSAGHRWPCPVRRVALRMSRGKSSAVAVARP